jgi:hypothetical protein
LSLTETVITHALFEHFLLFNLATGKVVSAPLVASSLSPVPASPDGGEACAAIVIVPLRESPVHVAARVMLRQRMFDPACAALITRLCPSPMFW